MKKNIRVVPKFVKSPCQAAGAGRSPMAGGASAAAPPQQQGLQFHGLQQGEHLAGFSRHAVQQPGEGFARGAFTESQEDLLAQVVDICVRLFQRVVCGQVLEASSRALMRQPELAMTLAQGEVALELITRGTGVAYLAMTCSMKLRRLCRWSNCAICIKPTGLAGQRLPLLR